jgi:uncharacterized protein YicC (UPF0701 family)
LNSAVTRGNMEVYIQLYSNEGATRNYTLNSAVTRGNKEVHIELCSKN